MAKWSIAVREVHISYREVEGTGLDTPEKAIEEAVNLGLDCETDKGLEFSHLMPNEHHTAEMIQENKSKTKAA